MQAHFRKKCTPIPITFATFLLKMHTKSGTCLQKYQFGHKMGKDGAQRALRITDKSGRGERLAVR